MSAWMREAAQRERSKRRAVCKRPLSVAQGCATERYRKKGGGFQVRELAKQVIRDAAIKAGMEAGKIYDAVEADNLTIKRPYMTIQFLPETFMRTGRKLDVKRTPTEIIRKRELYEVELGVACNVLFADEAWLSGFAYSFIANLPNGVNDARGNWVRVRAQKAQFSKPPDVRIGDKTIEVFKKRDQLFELAFTGRITEEQRESLITDFDITTHWKNSGGNDVHQKK